MIGLPEYIILLSQNWIVFDTVNSLPQKKALQKDYRLRCVEVSAISGISHTSLKNSEGKLSFLVVIGRFLNQSNQPDPRTALVQVFQTPPS